MEAVASGGKVVVVGMGQSRCTLDTDHLITKELDVHGCYRYTNTVSPAACTPAHLDKIIASARPPCQWGGNFT